MKHDFQIESLNYFCTSGSDRLRVMPIFSPAGGEAGNSASAPCVNNSPAAVNDRWSPSDGSGSSPLTRSPLKRSPLSVRDPAAAKLLPLPFSDPSGLDFLTSRGKSPILCFDYETMLNLNVTMMGLILKMSTVRLCDEREDLLSEIMSELSNFAFTLLCQT